MSSIVERVLNVDRVISFALSWLPCLRRVGVLGGLFIFKTVSRFQFYPSAGSGETHLLRKPPDREGRFGNKGKHLDQEKQQKTALGGKEERISFHISAIQLLKWRLLEGKYNIFTVCLLPVTIIK